MKFEDDNNYYVRLAKEYKAFSIFEADQDDWRDSNLFARKGLMAAKGQDVEAENPKDRNIPDEHMEQLMTAREMLQKVTSGFAKENSPKESARAQVMYDCWVEQKEEHWHANNINYCREEFYKMLNIVANNNNIHLCGKPIRSVSYNVNFDDGSSELSDSSKEILNTIIENYHKPQNKSYKIMISGHTDTTGKSQDNMDLSRDRAFVVKQYFLDHAIDENNLHAYFYGESINLIKTGNGVNEPANRRVAINIYSYQ